MLNVFKKLRKTKKDDKAEQGFEALNTKTPLLTIKDLIAPSYLEIDFRDVIVNSTINRTFYVTDYPRTVNPNFLDPLINIEEEGAITLYVYPISVDEILETLRQKIAELEASLMIQMQKGKVLDPKEKVKLEDAQKLIDRIAAGHERFFKVGLYMRIQAKNKKGIKNKTITLRSLLSAIGLKVNSTLLNAENGFNSTLPLMQDRLRKHHELDTTTISYMFPFTSYHLAHPDGILYGINLHSRSLVIFNRFRMPNANEVVFATSGAGKSYYVKLQVLRYMLLGVHCFIIDPEHEYDRLAKVLDGSYINFSTTSDNKINPFEFFTDPTKKTRRNLLQDKILSLHRFFRLLFRTELNALETAILDKALFLTYREKGITNDPSTWTKEPPLLEDLYKILKGMPEKEAQGLAERLLPYVVGSASGVFNQPTTIKLDNQLVIFSVRDLRDELRPLAMYLILDYLWSKIKELREVQKLLIIDEAWHLMQFEDSAQFVFSIAKRARKYNLGLTTISQDVDEFINSKYGKAVITNSSMKMLLKQDSSAIPLLAKLFNLTVGEKEFLTNAPVGEGLFFAGKYHLGLRVISSQLEHQLITSKPGEIKKINEDILLNLTKDKLLEYSKPYNPAVPSTSAF